MEYSNIIALETTGSKLKLNLTVEIQGADIPFFRSWLVCLSMGSKYDRRKVQMDWRSIPII